MRIIYYKKGMYKMPRPGQTTLGVTNSGSLTREMAIKTGNIRKHKKGHGARSLN